MNKILIPLFLLLPFTAEAQKVNDSNTPLHLLKPQYAHPYGIPTTTEVKQTIDRVLRYVDSETPAQLIDKKSGKIVSKLTDINKDTQLKQGGFRLTSYEWGVTYSAMLAAYEATSDKAYQDYVNSRHLFLAEIAPYFQKIYQKDKTIDGNIRRVIDPHALDDAGAICTSMIKALLKNASLPLRPLIDNYSDYVIN